MSLAHGLRELKAQAQDECRKEARPPGQNKHVRNQAGQSIKLAGDIAAAVMQEAAMGPVMVSRCKWQKRPLNFEQPEGPRGRICLIKRQVEKFILGLGGKSKCVYVLTMCVSWSESLNYSVSRWGAQAGSQEHTSREHERQERK
eukprot:evm.model.NODE_14129_length_13447_cov_24.871868.3